MMTVPTITRMVKVYVDAAAIERLKCGRPNERTVRNTLAGVRSFRRWLNERRTSLGYGRIGLDEDFPLVSIVTPQLVRNYLCDMLRRNVRPVTAVSYLTQLQQLFAKWVRPYYEDRDWEIPPFPSFGMRPQTQRYSRPSRETLRKVKEWYEALDDGMSFASRRSLVSGRQLWFTATMMLEFAMRNSDIERLTQENFVESEGRIYLNYTPHKTMNSSGRMVRWPVHGNIWARLTSGDEGRVDLPELSADVFDALNRQMRSLGFAGTKGAYELRKICIDHVYQKFGAERAVSVSGDDIKTIIRYYADPAQPNIGDVRITDLL